METIRAFIAIELTEDIHARLDDIQQQLKKTGADVKWVKSSQIHLTLKFLGEAPLDKIDSIISALENTVESKPPFQIELTGIGAFPKIEHPQIIWIGTEKGKEELKEIAFELEEKLETLGFKKEDREFSPHATLGRVRSSENRFALIKALKGFQMNAPLTQKAEHLSFIKSTLTPQRPVYEVLKKVELKGRGV